MKSLCRRTFRRVALGIGLASSVALAAPGFEGMERRVQPQTSGEVKYMCGGVGQLEAEYMKQAGRDYDVMLTFASRTGAYLADVSIDIVDTRGQKVLQTVCGGPIMLLDLPRAGNYRVHASIAGYDVKRTIRAADRGNRNYVFLWPEKAESAGAPASGISRIE